jgi:hypothetical protein
MDYTCWGIRELIEELEKRDAQKEKIGNWLHNFARFEKACKSSEYTDTDEAWRFMKSAQRLLKAASK